MDKNISELSRLISQTLSLAVPRTTRERMVFLSNRSRRVFVTGSSGSGKSILMGRHIAFADFNQGVPLVLLDPHGPLIDNFLDKFLRQPTDWKRKHRDRLRYVDMSGKSGYITPFPMYYRLGNESLAEIARRPLEIFLKLDPNLQSASIQGWNALKTVGTYFGMVASKFGLQATEAVSVLNYPKRWEGRIRQAVGEYPELAGALAFFRELSQSRRSHERRSLTSSFFIKIEQFTLDPYMRAQWAADKPGIDWEEVEEEGLAVLLDFRNIHDLEMRMFSMMFGLNYFLNYIKQRGAGRHQPISLIIDELTALFPVVGLTSEQLALDIDALMNQYARNYALWVCVSTQELYQFGERLAKTLLSMPVQIHGATSDPDAAKMQANRSVQYKPYWVKKYERVWMSDGFFGAYVVDHTSEEFTPEEQLELNSQLFMDLKPFQFLVRIPEQEGSLIGNLKKMSIANLDPGIYPDANKVATARQVLSERHGRPIGEVLSEIKSRTKLIEKINYPSSAVSKDERVEEAIPLWSD